MGKQPYEVPCPNFYQWGAGVVGRASGGTLHNSHHALSRATRQLPHFRSLYSLSLARPVTASSSNTILGPAFGSTSPTSIVVPSNNTLPTPNPRISSLAHPKSSTGERPNAYLNLPRLVSETNHIVLFPKLLPELRPTITYSHFRNATHLHSRNTPAVLTASRKIYGFPFSPFSPLVVHRDDTMWCDERFDFFGSPSVAWEERFCQFWITKRGGLHSAASKDPEGVDRMTVRRAPGC